LVHQPIYYALGGKLAKKYIGTGAAVSIMVVGFVVSLSIATLSWYLSESPILKLKGRRENRQQADGLVAA
jgi:peptidoglycan/LPS O-acetylase OafA/YrhL